MHSERGTEANIDRGGDPDTDPRTSWSDPAPPGEPDGGESTGGLRPPLEPAQPPVTGRPNSPSYAGQDEIIEHLELSGDALYERAIGFGIQHCRKRNGPGVVRQTVADTIMFPGTGVTLLDIVHNAIVTLIRGVPKLEMPFDPTLVDLALRKAIDNEWNKARGRERRYKGRIIGQYGSSTIHQIRTLYRRRDHGLTRGDLGMLTVNVKERLPDDLHREAFQAMIYGFQSKEVSERLGIDVADVYEMNRKIRSTFDTVYFELFGRLPRPPKPTHPKRGPKAPEPSGSSEAPSMPLYQTDDVGQPDLFDNDAEDDPAVESFPTRQEARRYLHAAGMDDPAIDRAVTELRERLRGTIRGLRAGRDALDEDSPQPARFVGLTRSDRVAPIEDAPLTPEDEVPAVDSRTALVRSIIGAIGEWADFGNFTVRERPVLRPPDPAPDIRIVLIGFDRDFPLRRLKHGLPSSAPDIEVEVVIVGQPEPAEPPAVIRFLVQGTFILDLGPSTPQHAVPDRVRGQARVLLRTTLALIGRCAARRRGEPPQGTPFPDGWWDVAGAGFILKWGVIRDDGTFIRKNPVRISHPPRIQRIRIIVAPPGIVAAAPPAINPIPLEVLSRFWRWPN